MELWFIYALGSVLFGGLFVFSSKLSVEKNHNPNNITAFSMIIGGIIALIFFFIYGDKNTNILLCFLLAFINGFTYLITILTRIKSLKYIDTSIYFPVYKAVGPILILIISVFIFGEFINNTEKIGIILGVAVPIILVSRNKKSLHIGKGLIYLFIGLFTSMAAAISVKVATINNIDILLFSVFVFGWGTVFSLLVNFIQEKKHKKKYSKLHFKRTGIITGFLNMISFYFFVKAIELGNNLGIVYTINSLYIVIPIILSIVIYKEHFDTKKFIALFLTIASIFFLK